MAFVSAGTQSFSMKGNKNKRYYGAHSRRALKVKGHFHCSGPQPVCDGGVPEWVDKVFGDNPEIKLIAISGEDNGHVYSRMEDER